MNSLTGADMTVPPFQGLQAGLDPWAGMREYDLSGGSRAAAPSVQAPYGADAMAKGPVTKNFAEGAPKSAVGFNLDTLQLGISGIATLGSLWNAWESQKLARDNFNMQKEFGNANLNNQIRSYNTGLDDKARSRGAFEGQTQAEIDKYVEDNKARR